MALTVISIILFQGLIFLGLAFLLSQFMKGNVKGELGHLQQLNDELMKRQAELKVKNEAAEKEYSEKMAKLEQEITARQAKLNQEASKTLEDARDKGMKEREKLINEAIETREKIRQEIMAEMEDKAIHYSHDILADFFSGGSRKMLHDILIDQLLEGLEAVDLAAFQIQTDVAEVRVAQSLDEPTKKNLLNILKKKIHRDVQCHEQIEEALIGGIILKFGSFVIDGSMANRLHEAAARLKKETRRRYQSTT